MRIFLFFFLVATSFTSLEAQQKITLEDIWEKYTFYTRSVPGFNFLNDGKHYTRLEDGKINKYDLTTGQFVETILDESSLGEQASFGGKISSYSFSNDESLIVIKSESQQIYRRSSIAKFHIYNRSDKSLRLVYEDGKISYATLSPDNQKVAFVHENNLYFRNLDSGLVTQVTTDGEKNKIINGSTDWVYEEEFSFVKAFYWSADSKKIAFIRFDESEVPEFTMTRYNGDLYPEYETWKYPKVGEKNADVSAHIYHLNSKQLDKADIGDETDIYIPRLKWTNDADKLIVFKMNRHQNNLKLYQIETSNNTSSILLEESNKYYIDITDDLTFLEDGSFLWTSEKEGYNQIYHYNSDGSLNKKLTTGDYDVSAFYGVSEKQGKIYYQSAEKNALTKQVFSMNLDGTGKQLMTPRGGTNNAQFSSTFDYYVNKHSDINSPPTYTVWSKELKTIRTIENNQKIVDLQKSFNVSPVEHFKFKTEHNVRLNGYMIKPIDFDPNKKYPVFMYQYSGPGSQSAQDSWKGNNYWWFQMLAQNGYIVACVDGRGTGMRGEEFKKMTYLQLGKYETVDQIDAAKYLAQQAYVDGSRIGIYGWSYGGYMSSLCILKGNDVFKAAIAVAPVTSWKWYDTVYTERYMRTVAENEDGYANNSPVYFADRLKGSYLLVHGLADDNVHFQNTSEMANALIKANKQFDTYFYPNRNHGIYGDNARIHLFTKMTNFIYKNI
jgi:dipeptidyl-peptidase-4